MNNVVKACMPVTISIRVGSKMTKDAVVPTKYFKS